MFAQPTWQVGQGLPTPSNKVPRLVPDIAADADPKLRQCRPRRRAWGQGGGTSLSSPIWAGFTALMDQYLQAQHGKGPVGFLNPALYYLADHTESYPPFHLVTTGGNEVWRNEAGYNESTGLGSPDVYNLARDILALRKGPTSMSDQPSNPPPVPRTCLRCRPRSAPIAPMSRRSGDYCGVCGSHLAHPHPGVAARRPHAYSANPEEHVLRLSVVSTLFPHLSHRSSAPFRVGFALLVALLVIFSATGLEAPVIALAAMGVPLLFQLYIYEVDVYEDGHLCLTAETLLIGAVLGVGWALLGGPIVSHALQPTLGATSARGMLQGSRFGPHRRASPDAGASTARTRPRPRLWWPSGVPGRV